MANVLVLGFPKVQFFNPTTGAFLSGGLLYSYTASTTSPCATYPTITDATNSTNANANPVVLDSTGSAMVVLSGGTKLILKDSLGNQVWAVDNLNIVASSGITGNLTVGGTATVSGATTLTGAVSLGSTLAVTGVTTLSAALNVVGNTSLTGTLGVSGATTVGGTLGVTGATTVGGALGVSGNTTASGTLAVTGASTLTGATTVGSTLGVTGALTATAGIVGKVDGSSAAAGVVGELLASAFSGNVTMTTSTTVAVQTLTLTAGDWNVYAALLVTPAASTTVQHIIAAMNTSNANLPVPSSVATSNIQGITTTFTTGAQQYFPMGVLPISVNGSTTIYLNANITFGVSTLVTQGIIFARRIR